MLSHLACIEMALFAARGEDFGAPARSVCGIRLAAVGT
jgi:hypothetical protein